MLELGSTFFPTHAGAKLMMIGVLGRVDCKYHFAPIWGKTEHGIREWGFRNTFVAVTRDVANIFPDASLETCL